MSPIRPCRSTVFNEMAAVALTMVTDARTTRLDFGSTLAVGPTIGSNPRNTAAVGRYMATDGRNMDTDRRKVDTDR